MGQAPSLGASFRDPSGYVFRHEGRVHRFVASRYREEFDLAQGSGFFAAAMEEGLLVRHEELAPNAVAGTGDAYRVLLPEPIPLVSYPYEWCFGQLRDAALLTLQLQRRAMHFGLSLKDASAYNVQFLRGRPVFIDTLSFEAYREGLPWVAYGQFCRHFLAPLTLMARVHIDLGRLQRSHPDGVPLDVASAMLPSRSWLDFGLLTHLHMHGRAQLRHADSRESASRARAARVSRTGLLGILESLEKAITRVRWEPTGTTWADYYGDTNYSEAAARSKNERVSSFCEQVAPATVWDLGANVGVHARLAAARGAFTVAFDVDPAAVELDYRRVKESGEENLLPLLMDLRDPSPALGWDHREREALETRGPADLVLALALVHHLAIGNNVPLPRVAAMLRRLARHLVVEWVPKTDSQVARMLAIREDIFDAYTQEAFEAAFAAHFDLLRCEPVEDSERHLYLYAARGVPTDTGAD